MDSTRSLGPIAWDQVRERIPSTAHDLLQEILQAYEQDPDDPARGIERALRSRIAQLRSRFNEASGGVEP
jgi:hypothetical protein